MGCVFHLFEVCFSVAFLFLYLSPTVVVWSWMEQSLKYRLIRRAFAHLPHNAPHHHSDHSLHPNLPSHDKPVAALAEQPLCNGSLLLSPAVHAFPVQWHPFITPRRESLLSDFTVKTFLMEVSDQSHFPKKVVLPKIDNCFHCHLTLPTLTKDHHIKSQILIGSCLYHIEYHAISRKWVFVLCPHTIEKCLRAAGSVRF